MLTLRRLVIPCMITAMLGLWVMSGANAADPFALTVVPVGRLIGSSSTTNTRRPSCR